MLSVENVATPAMAFSCAVPLSVPLAGFVPIAMVIWFVAVVTRLPRESSTLTWIAGVIELPAATDVGWTEIASFAAAPAVTLKALLVALVSPDALAPNV